MSKPNKYAAIDLFSEPTTTGVANTNDWVASMRGMVLMCADGLRSMRAMQLGENKYEDGFENHIAATLNLNEPNAGSWDQIKTKYGL